MPKVSIIIPCFNLGRYIHNAIESVLSQDFQDIEIIIINDGSTDKETNSIIEQLHHAKIKVIQTGNKGPAAARNVGISQASGEYILPLDADDKIASTYVEKAVKVLDENENVGIVYCEAEYFGQITGKWNLPDYSFPKILLGNSIFCSGFFRKSDWEKTNGYGLGLIDGWEDYDFWLSIIELGREVYKIPETLFFYCKRSGSRTDLMEKEHLLNAHVTIFNNHKDLYIENIEHIFEHIYYLREENLNLHNTNTNLREKRMFLLTEFLNLRGFKRLLVDFVSNKIGVLINFKPKDISQRQENRDRSFPILQKTSKKNDIKTHF